MNVSDSIRILWDYHHIGRQPKKSDVIIALGSYDLRVAAKAATLWHQKYSSTILCSGAAVHSDGLLATEWKGSEAEQFAKHIFSKGVSEDSILIEPNATNTAENLKFAQEILQRRNIAASSYLLVTKPNMERRVQATAEVVFSNELFHVTSPNLTIEEYVDKVITYERLANLMVGDLQRIILYATKGFSSVQYVPDFVMDAANLLVKSGYDKHLIQPWETMS